MKTMRRREYLGAVLATAMVVAAAPAHAQTTAAAKATLDPGAMAALQSMGAYLRTLKTFQVEAVTTNEDVLEDGQKTQYAGTVTHPRPACRAGCGRRCRTSGTSACTSTTARASRSSRSGSTTTRRCPPRPRSGSWPTSWTRTTASACRSRTSSAGARPAGARTDITGATDLGPSVVLGTTCQHYAFRQDDIDWQIWIQKGDNPLPRKLVITTKTDEARPQHTAVYTWNLAPSFNDAAFTFDPPAGAGKVVLAEIKAAAAATK